MTSILLYSFIFIITLLILVTIHEWGHFWVARRLGVKTLRFSFGFGKPLFRRVGRDGTEYVFSLLPLGGYVQLLDTRTQVVPASEKHRAFDTQSLWVRLSILFAGPLMNLVLGFVAFTLVFIIGIQRVVPIVGEVVPYSIAQQAHLPTGAEIKMLDDQPVNSWQQVGMLLVEKLGDSDQLMIGVRMPDTSVTQAFALSLAHWQIDSLQPDPLKSLGIVPYHPAMPPIIDRVEKNSAAEKAAIKQGDRVLSLNHRPVKDWRDLVTYIKTLPGKTVPVEIARAGQRTLHTVTLDKRLGGLHWEGKMGIAAHPPIWPENKRYLLQLGLPAALQEAAHEVKDMMKFNIIVIKKLLTGKISLLSMGGPLAIFETSTLAFQQGIAVYLSFLGLLSVMLACINLLPIPALDGGQILFCLIESFIRRPISLRWQQLFLNVSAAFLVFLMVQATINDLLRLL